MEYIKEFICKYSTEIISALTTLVAAYTGAWFAFIFQRNYEKRKIDNENINFLNMTFIRLFHQYNDLLNIKKEFISPIENDPIKWLNIPALSTRTLMIDPDISDLSFLIELRKSDLISDILLATEKYKECIKSVNIRSDIHLNRLQPIIEKIGSQDFVMDKNLLENALGQKLQGELQNITEQIFILLADTIKYYELLLTKTNNYGKEIFPKKIILNFALKEIMK
jgi:hypothetical protein